MPRGSQHHSREAREMVIPVLVSFETGEQVTDLRLYPPTSADWRLIGVRYEVVKALTGSNAGTIQVKDPSGNAAITQISIPASSALGTRGQATLSGTDSRLRVGSSQPNAYHALATAKGLEGGKVQLWLHYRRIPVGSASA